MTTSANPRLTLTYDPDEVARISDRLMLRTPNREGLEKLAERFDQADGAPFEAVCEIATAVGKTYLAAGLIDYLFAKGVRNILILVPGRTVRSKTIDNFTPGHPKAVPGIEADFRLVTRENFNTAETRQAFEDEGVLKLFVFTVQSLMDSEDAKTREHQEWLGQRFYDYLAGCDDLVVIADEHHTYASQAEVFYQTLRDLNSMAIVGLTATAADSQREHIIYEYPLAKALRDKLVKKPVLVGRTDRHTDLVTRMADGLTLLDAKQKVINDHCIAKGLTSFKAVMLIVCKDIDQADHVKQILARPQLLGAEAEHAVLVIHHQSSDEALELLARVEEPTSEVRVIVSVSKLKEGWDVKNIFVIASLRPSISETLTEQTLGRGLRLPFGKHTQVELLDTVEVLAHDKYEELLASAGILFSGITEVRAASVPASQFPEAPVSHDSACTTCSPGPDPRTGSTNVGVTSGPATGTPHATSQPESMFDFDDADDGFLIAETDDRIRQATAQAAASLPVPALRSVRLPKVEARASARPFSLSDIDDREFAKVGVRVASAHAAKLDRKVLEVVEESPGNFVLAPKPGEALDAAVVSLPMGGVKSLLVDAIMSMDFVPQTRASRNGADRLVQAAIDAAGGEDKLAAYHHAAVQLTRATLRASYKATPMTEEEVFSLFDYAPGRETTLRREPNRFGKFEKKAAYEGWTRSTHAHNWFDSEPERALANLLDADLAGAGVEVWSRIQRHEQFHIRWQGATYTPDFYARIGGTNYLLEVKSDQEATTDQVQQKKRAAERLARALNDEGDMGNWEYLLITEWDLKNITNLADLLQTARGN